jgi:hypothetical protein
MASSWLLLLVDGRSVMLVGGGREQSSNLSLDLNLLCQKKL